MSAGDWVTALAGILSPTKYLHNQAMAATRRDEKERAERNAEMALVAMEMAREGYTVELICTNASWVTFRALPVATSPSFNRDIRDAIAKHA